MSSMGQISVKYKVELFATLLLFILREKVYKKIHKVYRSNI